MYNVCLGHFHAATNNDGSVVAMASSTDDVYLITGDTSGHVTVWNIQDYCVTDQGEVRLCRCDLTKCYIYVANTYWPDAILVHFVVTSQLRTAL